MADDRPLAGLTILDFTRVLAGPYCTRLLADLGARVLKIERPGDGDDVRRGLVQLEDGRADQSTYFVRINVGKLGVGLDLQHPDARAVVRDLAAHADVAVENFAPGVAGRLGCDWATLASVKPDLVYCSISGYGQAGPLARRPAFAHVVHAMSGLMDLEYRVDPAPRPLYLQAADVLAGTHAFGAILAALWRRARTGRGGYVDVSMLETLVAADDVTFGAVLNGGRGLPAGRPGMMVHKVGGRFVALQIVGALELWPRLVRLLERPDLVDDPRFATPLDRRSNWEALRVIIAAWLDRFTDADTALAALTDARIPCAPVLTPEEVIAHPHLAGRGAFPEVPHPGRGRVRVTATPFHLDGAPVTPAGPAPYRVGEHTRAVLRDVLGYDDARIAALAAAGVVAVV